VTGLLEHSDRKAKFPKLKHLRLHELPKLYGIVSKTRISRSMPRIYAPNLETVKIRGCWHLRKLPMVGGDKVVSCDCEKEWWDKLEWDRMVQPSNYKPIHSQHYKKTMIRGSALRCVPLDACAATRTPSYRASIATSSLLDDN
jgi:hypothetical protein